MTKMMTVSTALFEWHWCCIQATFSSSPGAGFTQPGVNGLQIIECESAWTLPWVSSAPIDGILGVSVTAVAGGGIRFLLGLLLEHYII